MNPSNLLDLDYRVEALKFKRFDSPLVDVHCHLSGPQAIQIYKEAAQLYGVGLTYSMTQLESVPEVKEVMGDAVRFIAVPQFRGSDPLFDHGRGYIERIKKFHALGATVAKFWSAPRIFDFIKGDFAGHPLRLDAPGRMDAVEAAVDLGMKLMVHVADPDTWFATKYADARRYGTKEQHYEPLRKLLLRFDVPVLAAHMGGYPENLPFLSSLLRDHPNLYLDSSATKWIVRELGKHPREEVLAFFVKWKGRIVFGTDIVTSESHLSPHAGGTEMDLKAASHAEAFDLYASRFWALRTLFETSHDGKSPISDPDLAMVEPKRCSPEDSPPLRGKSLPDDALATLYFGAARAFIE